MNILSIREHPEMIPALAQWQSSKWGIPLQAYVDSMEEALHVDGVPAWYFIPNEAGEIIAGLGIIENDFHKRKDLRPNLCALYVEEAYRRQGLARTLLDHACAELAEKGISTAYLITGHTGLYENMGWRFYGMIEEDDGSLIRMYVHELK